LQAAGLLIAWVGLYLSLPTLADGLAYGIIGLEKDTRLGSAIVFFLYETPKVILLLTLVVFLVGIVRSFFSPEKTRSALEKRTLLSGNILASLLGIVTPFCSCSAVPLFIGFVEAGIPLGVTFSFLIAAPMINEVAVVLLFGLFGWRVALLYVGMGLMVAITAGYVMGKLKLERHVESWVFEVRTNAPRFDELSTSWNQRIEYGYAAVKEIVAKVWIYLLVGIAVGAGIHGYVPENFMAEVMGRSAWWAVPVSVLIGIPLYSNAAGIIPIVHALLEKGAALGTTLAFMMSVIGLSLPEVIILRKVLKLPLILVFVGVVATGILIVGYLFNALL
jgi:uncharacterized membrane protein YraQ (UPF0718 family)